MEFTLKTIFDASPELIYTTWLDSEGHSRMTGGDAFISDKIGSEFSAWDGYIEGVILELETSKRILQSWRTSDFDESDEDSTVEILLEEMEGKTKLTLIHTKLSAHGEQYKTGWDHHYFQPMKAYFSQLKK